MMTASLWGGRYMAWMALGGTLKRIPQDILQLVAATPILGVRRQNLNTVPGSNDPTGNMLNLAKGFCEMILPDPHSGVYAFVSNSALNAPTYPPYNHGGSPLIATNYDREMWLHLCTDFNPQVVRVYGSYTSASDDTIQTLPLLQMYYANDPG